MSKMQCRLFGAFYSKYIFVLYYIFLEHFVLKFQSKNSPCRAVVFCFLFRLWAKHGILIMLRVKFTLPEKEIKWHCNFDLIDIQIVLRPYLRYNMLWGTYWFSVWIFSSVPKLVFVRRANHWRWPANLVLHGKVSEVVEKGRMRLRGLGEDD